MVKNGTRTAELVQQRRRRVRSSGQKFFVLTRPAFLRRQTLSHLLLNDQCSVLRGASVVLCSLLVIAMTLAVEASAPKSPSHRPSSSSFSSHNKFLPFSHHNSIPFSSNLNAFLCPSHQYIFQHLVILNVEKGHAFFPLPLSDITSRTSSSPLPPASPSEVASPGPSWSLRAFVRSVKTFN